MNFYLIPSKRIETERTARSRYYTGGRDTQAERRETDVESKGNSYGISKKIQWMSNDNDRISSGKETERSRDSRP